MTIAKLTTLLWKYITHKAQEIVPRWFFLCHRFIQVITFR